MKRTVILFLFLSYIPFQAFSQSNHNDNDHRPEAPSVNQNNIVTINHINLYPNPVHDFINVKIENSTLKNVEFELYNIIGNSLSLNVEELSQNNYKLDIKDIHPGYYLVVIKDPVKRFNKSYKFQKL